MIAKGGFAIGGVHGGDEVTAVVGEGRNHTDRIGDADEASSGIVFEDGFPLERVGDLGDQFFVCWVFIG